MEKSSMYADTKTWNPYVGCLHECIYCKVSFQRQLKRWGKKHCEKCYSYTPHYHPERLKRIPSAKTVFVCGDGDIAFCNTAFLGEVVERIAQHSRRYPCKTFYFQSKDWSQSEKLIPLLEGKSLNAIVLETLETNRDAAYSFISKAPKPSERHRAFVELNYPRKAVTAEPLLDFDVNAFFKMIVDAEPEFVWIGYNSKPKLVSLPEPPLEKTAQLIGLLKASGVEVRGKELRGLEL